MATLRTVTVGPGGGPTYNYGSLNAAEAGEQGNLVTLDRQLDIECYAMSDTTAVVVDGSTTDATRYIRIFTPTSERHDGKWNTSKYRLEPTNALALTVSDNHVRVDGLQITVVSPSVARLAVSWSALSAGSDVRLSNTIIAGDGTVNSTGVYQSSASGTLYMWNCIVYGCAGSLSGVRIGASVAAYIYNCTSVNNGAGFRTSGIGIVTIKNCLASGNAGGNDYRLDTSASWNAASNYNASSSATATGGANDRTSQTFTFVGAGDYHLAVSDVGAKGYGVADPGSGLFTTDIDGQTRSGAWDIGADQYIAAGGPSPITGTSSITLEAITPTAAGALTITGQSSAVLDMLTQVSTGTARISAGSVVTLADVTGTASANVLTRGQSINALADLTGTGTGVTAIVGSQTAILEALTGTATATIGNVISGSGSVTLDDLIMSMTGTARVTGASSATLADLTGTGTGTVSLTGAQSQMLLDAVASAVGTVTITGNSATVLAALTQVVTAYIGDDVALEPGPHEIVILLSPITRTVYQASPITRTVNRSSEVH